MDGPSFVDKLYSILKFSLASETVPLNFKTQLVQNFCRMSLHFWSDTKVFEEKFLDEGLKLLETELIDQLDTLLHEHTPYGGSKGPITVKNPQVYKLLTLLKSSLVIRIAITLIHRLHSNSSDASDLKTLSQCIRLLSSTLQPGKNQMSIKVQPSALDLSHLASIHSFCSNSSTFSSLVQNPQALDLLIEMIQCSDSVFESEGAEVILGGLSAAAETNPHVIRLVNQRLFKGKPGVFTRFKECWWVKVFSKVGQLVEQLPSVKVWNEVLEGNEPVLEAY